VGEEGRAPHPKKACALVSNVRTKKRRERTRETNLRQLREKRNSEKRSQKQKGRERGAEVLEQIRERG